MRKWLSIFGASPSPLAPFEDPVLGQLRFEEASWSKTLEASAGEIVLRIGGVGQPDERLIANVRPIVSDFAAFESRIGTYLEGEASQARWTSFADEIRRLRIAEVCYLWPEEPRSGMVFFDGSNAERIWHCDLEAEEPYGLAFDD